MEKRDLIGRAHKLATEIEGDDLSVVDASQVFAMALAILAEATEGAHRNLWPLCEGMTRAAQIAFDALRDSRNRPRI